MASFFNDPLSTGNSDNFFVIRTQLNR